MSIPMPLKSHRGDKDGLKWVLCTQWIYGTFEEHWAWGIYCFYSDQRAKELREDLTLFLKVVHCKHNPEKWPE